VLIESELAIVHRPVEIAESTEFSRYCDSGGRLLERIYNQAQKAFQESAIKNREFDKSTRTQVEHYAAQFKIPLTPKQRFIYCFLREEAHLTLPDQGVFAEMLLMTEDPVKYSEVTSFYPNIFRK
jgi:hypothetical protein